MAVLSTAAAVTGACLTLLRQAGAPSWSTLWAEDGAVFLTEAWALGPEVVLQPYSGYLHLVPRLLAEVAVLVPIDVVAPFVVASSALVAAALGVFVYHATADLLRPLGRAVLGAAFVLAPTLAEEVAGNLTNLHWYLFAAAFFAILWRPPTWPAAAVATGLAAAAALSSPMGLLLGPIALACAVLPGRPLRARSAAAVYAVAVSAQALVIVAGGVPGPAERVIGREVVGVFALRVVGPLLLGRPGAVALWRWRGMAGFVLLCVVVSVVLLAGIVVARHRPARWFPVLSVAVALSAFAAPLVLRGQHVVDTLQWDHLIQTGGARYTAAPALLLLAALVWAVDALHRSLPAPLGSWVAATGVVVLAGAFTLSFSARNDRSSGPLWHEGVALRAARCAEPGTSEVGVPVAPPLPDGEWAATVPCSVLTR